MDEVLMLPPGWLPAEPWDDELVACYCTHPFVARAWIERGQNEPVMLEADGDDESYSEPPPKVAGWLTTTLYIEGLR